MKKEQLEGKIFGRLTILYRDGYKYKKIAYRCKCSCGNEKLITKGHLKSGFIKSCGCLHKESAIEKNKKYCTTHGFNKTPTYNTHRSMMQRCYYKKNNSYESYGGRGIKVCKRWHKFENFLKDMGERPKGKSLDRIDNNDDYKKKNCRWSSSKEQSNNRRNNILITYNGETKSVDEWSKITGIKRATLERRFYNKNWSTELTLTTRVLTAQEGTLLRFNKIDLKDERFRLK